ncbi:hypothetical protein HALDL1_04610 [Halobacterium sp. DL1]|nr:hypothetical protein HALDL1_04610 [Halobacterium sp. DL1]
MAGLSLLLILVLMIGRVASRNLDLGWSGLQIIAQFFEVWLAFLVVGALAYERGHIEIDYLSQRLPESWQPIHDILVSVVSLATGLVVLLGSLRAMTKFADSTAPVVQIPIPLYYLAPVVGLGFLVIVYVHRIYTDVNEVLA